LIQLSECNSRYNEIKRLLHDKHVTRHHHVIRRLHKIYHSSASSHTRKKGAFTPRVLYLLRARFSYFTTDNHDASVRKFAREVYQIISRYIYAINVGNA